MRACESDAALLCGIFIGHISAHKEYISHGEIQMGVGIGYYEDGVFKTGLAEDAIRNWMKYIHGHIVDEDSSAVYKAVAEDGEIIGFCVVEIMSDGADPFGMICDLLVNENNRSAGVGTALLDEALAWLKSRSITDIYLESGIKNHAAHEYFMRRGFLKISEIYKLV